MSLKLTAIKSFGWTAFEMVFNQGSIFIVGIILARILSPSDFGIIGIITAFIAISNSIVEGGFSSALLRKEKPTDADFSTIFYINLLFSIILYGIIALFSQEIAVFFEIPILESIFYYSGIILIINASFLIQKTILTINLDFKTQSVISIISAIISGTIAVIMAYSNYGIWSLVALNILRPLINSILYWIVNKWKPKLIFSLDSFKELFNFGYKLLIANLINTTYKNIYYVLIGKYFSASSLGFYTRAEQFQQPVAGNITAAIRRISFPILSKFQTDNENLKRVFIKFLKFSVFLNFTVLLSIAAIAKSLIIVLIGEKWIDSVYYLQLLCIPGMIYPLQILHLNLLLVKGYSNLNLKLEIIKKIILVPIILISVNISIDAMIYGLVLFSFTEYFINSYYTRKIINYSLKEQIKDLIPFLLISFFTALPVYFINYLNLITELILVIQIIVGIICFIAINEILKTQEYNELKNEINKILSK